VPIWTREKRIAAVEDSSLSLPTADMVLSAMTRIWQILFESLRLALIFPRKYKELLLVRRLLGLYRLTVMKQPMINPDTDQNWNWPEKTWFQERLNAIKAKEQGLRRRPMVVAQKPAVVISKPEADKEPGKIELSPPSPDPRR